MQAKKPVCFFITLLLLSMLTVNVDAASDTTVFFSGAGVTISLTYPNEAYPNTNITHYVTITSSTIATLRNFTVVIKAPVNSSWQQILNGMNVYGIPPQLPQQYSLTLELPEDAKGILECFVFVNTSSIDDLSTTFYTTLVSDPTFSEIQSEYDELLEEYISLNASFTDLNETYVNLNATFQTLLEQNEELIYENDNLYDTWQQLDADYNKLSEDYDNLKSDYDSKIAELGDLETSYDELNITRYDLQENLDRLQGFYDNLNATYTQLLSESDSLEYDFNASQDDLSVSRIVMLAFIIAVAALVAFIVYIKRKQQDPYLVIRKETVNLKSDEKP